jgi:hypothetical protein
MDYGRRFEDAITDELQSDRARPRRQHRPRDQRFKCPAHNQGGATVNLIFTWVRLAQRIPVSVHIDETPPSVILAAGMTATVEIDDRTRGRIGALHFSELGSLSTHRLD